MYWMRLKTAALALALAIPTAALAASNAANGAGATGAPGADKGMAAPGNPATGTPQAPGGSGDAGGKDCNKVANPTADQSGCKGTGTRS